MPVVAGALVGVPLAFAGVARADVLPASAASPPHYANTATFDVPYTASDEGGPGLDHVDLYAKGPGDLTYMKVATDATPNDTQSFSYTASEGDGSYAFYTVAVDTNQIPEPPPLVDDGQTLVDAAAPSSSATAPASSNGGPLTITYTSTDSGSGVASVELWAKGPNDADHSLAATDTSPDSPSFSYSPAEGDGSYSFYTVAADTAGNREAAPASPDATTAVQSPVQQPSLPIVAAVTLPSKQNLRVVVRKGLLIKLSAFRPVTLHLTLLLQPRTAKTVGLRRRQLVTRTIRATKPNVYQIRLRLKKSTAQRLRRLKKARFELRTVLATRTGTSKATSRFILTRR